MGSTLIGDAGLVVATGPVTPQDINDDGGNGGRVRVDDDRVKAVA
jgi:hypothetical protein